MAGGASHSVGGELYDNPLLAQRRVHLRAAADEAGHRDRAGGKADAGSWHSPSLGA